MKQPINVTRLSILFWLIASPLVCRQSFSQQLAGEFTITVNSAEAPYALVEARLVPQGRLLTMNIVPTPSLADGAAAFVSELKVITLKGAAIPVTYLGKGKWQLAQVPADTFVLRYRLAFDHELYNDWPGGKDEHGYRVVNGVFLRSSSLFILNGTNPYEGYRVTFNLPGSWHASTPWRESAPGTYDIESFRTLVYNGLFLGNAKSTTILFEEFELRILAGKGLQDQQHLFIALLEPMFASYANMFGGIPPAPAYLVVLNRHNFTDGSAFNNSFSQVFSQPVNKNGYMVWGRIMAHELLHYWIGSSIIAQQQEEWFNEGFTDYLTAYHMVRTGILNRSQFTRLLEMWNSRLFIARVLLGRSSTLQEAGNKKALNWHLIYGGGPLLAFALDIELRKATNNKAGLEAVMQQMYDEFGQQTQRYTHRDVIRIASDVAGESLDPFFTRYLLGHGSLNISEYLKNLGLELQRYGEECYISEMPVISSEQKRFSDNFFLP